VPLIKYAIGHQLTTFQVQDESATIPTETPRCAKRSEASLSEDASDDWGPLSTNDPNNPVREFDEDAMVTHFYSVDPDWSPLQQLVGNIGDSINPDTSKKPKGTSKASGSAPVDGSSLWRCLRGICQNLLTEQDDIKYMNGKSLVWYKYCKEHRHEIRQRVSSWSCSGFTS